jgi:hypothetical protein
MHKSQTIYPRVATGSIVKIQGKRYRAEFINVDRFYRIETVDEGGEHHGKEIPEQIFSDQMKKGVITIPSKGR